MKKLIALVLSLAMAFSFAACGIKNEIVETKTLPVSIASEPESIDPALNSTVDGSTLIIHAFSGLASYRENDLGKIELYADCAKELVEPTKNSDGTYTYVYELKDGLKWSDGSELTAHDFVFAWNRAASPDTGGGYSYMFEIIDGYEDVAATDDKGKPLYPGAKLNVTASDDGKTITVVTINKVDYWNELLSFPVFMPVNSTAVADESWATDPKKYVCNGPYFLSEWEHNSKMVYKKNPNYHNASAVTMEKIEFYLSDDANNMFANFKSNDWLYIENVPTNEIKSLKNKYSDELVIANQLGTYYINFNINQNLLPEGNTLKGKAAQNAQNEIRRAIALLIDRNYIVKNIAQCNQIPASSFVAAGITEPNGAEFYKNAGTSPDYDGYWNVSKDAYKDNCIEAVTLLKKYYKFDDKTSKFTNVPTIEYIYNTDDKHKAIGEYLQSVLGQYGIKVEMTNQEWSTFVNTRRSGDYTLARNAWVADYNDPLCFLDMWVSNSGNNDAQLGRGTHGNTAMYSIDLNPYGIGYKVQNGTWSMVYDRLIYEIKRCDNAETRFKLMHIAEDMLMQTGAIVPLYFDTDLYMINKGVHGFFASPFGYKYFMYTNF
ncbi:MAG: peptide ABC transporter substrate-binding protein [Clostridia bacterium]|nr:peptide ABC transporter substrate-binding protein [Clostridia bacterium]MBQ7046313.1 peptide ABC transporter substrate-binding protein [Oscillospiraceae bacterium]